MMCVISEPEYLIGERYPGALFFFWLSISNVQMLPWVLSNNSEESLTAALNISILSIAVEKYQIKELISCYLSLGFEIKHKNL